MDDLNIQSLLDRLDENTKEVIIATNPTREGETTALFLAKLLNKKNITISRIANGLPIGSSLDYADELTLLRSLEDRKKI
jgi:recombination protein RecR